MSELVRSSRDGEVSVLTIDNPPVNALSPGVPEGLAAGIADAQADGSIRAVVVIGAGRTFIAGADIREFGKITSGEKPRGSLHPLLLAIEDSSKPVVMAIHGTAFGGGLEVAMAGHYRVAVAGAQVGQPEVKLGIIPGAGGTQRLPRLAGVAKAVEMCAFGEPVAAPAAREAGIIDRIIEGDLLGGAIAFAREVMNAPPPKPREREGKLGDAASNAAVFAAARERARKTRRGWMCTLAAIDAVEAATTLPFDAGCQREAALFTASLHSDQSKALIHAFFGERAVARIPGIPKDTLTLPIHTAAVLGAGTMGGGIAMNFANAGIPVRIKDASRATLDRGMATIQRNYANSVRNGRFSQAVMDQRLALITPQLDYEGFEHVDIIAEAVFEGMDLKREVFALLDDIANPHAILASNTSTLSIDAIAAATKRPERVIGHHYFSPANVMRLLEIVRGAQTSKEVIATSMALARRLNKVGVLVGNCRGFVGNRMLGLYGREAQFLVEEGASVEQVDRVLYDFGMAMGPLTMNDLAGLDVGWRIRKEYKHLAPAGSRQPRIADRLCELGRYGQKTGAGYYRYEDDRKPSHDPEVDAVILEVAREQGITRREVAGEEILERTIYSLVNEGAKILEEGIALRASDIDIIYLTGYGFPPYRGGPMWFASTVGLARVHERVCEYDRRFGGQWTPAPLLARLAAEGRTFEEYDRERNA